MGNGGHDSITAYRSINDINHYYIAGGNASDTISVGRGDFTINGGIGAGIDVITVDAAYATIGSKYSIIGGTSNNISLSLGSSTVLGGTGNDSIIVGLGDATVMGNGGNDTIIATGGNDASQYFIAGGKSADFIQIGLGKTSIDGGGGNDTINIIYQGDETLSFANSNVAVKFDMGSGNINVSAYGNTTIISTNNMTINNIVGPAYNDTMKAGVNTKAMDGGSGGIDAFDLNYAGGAAPVILTGNGASPNILTFAADTISGVKVDILNNSVSGGYGNADISNAHIQNITASKYDDTITLGTLNSTVIGNGGNDSIAALLGSITNVYSLTGNTGNDTFNLGAGKFTVIGGGGKDVVDATSGAAGSIYSLTGNTGADKFLLGAGSYTVSGGGGADTFSTANGISTATYSLTGSLGDDSFNLGLGAHTIIAGGGADSLNISSQGVYTLNLSSSSSSIIADLTSTLITEGSYGSVGITGGIVQNIILSNLSDTVTASATTLSIDGGSAAGGADTYVMGSSWAVGGNLTIKNSGSGSVLDFSKDASGVVVDVIAHTATSGSGKLNFAGIAMGSIIGTGQNDTFKLDSGIYTIDDHGGNDIISVAGGQGSYTLNFANSTAGINANMVANSINEGAYGTTTIMGGYVQNVIGSVNNDTFTASNTTKILDGGTGGSDTFLLGNSWAGGGVLTIKSSSAGYNTLDFSTDSSSAIVDLTADTAKSGTGSVNLAGANINSVIGSTGNDTFTSNSLTYINGNGGNDTLIFKGAHVSTTNNNYSLSLISSVATNMTNLDLSSNTNPTSGAGINYTISVQDIMNMATSASKNINIITNSVDTHYVSTGTGVFDASSIVTVSGYTVHWMPSGH